MMIGRVESASMGDVATGLWQPYNTGMKVSDGMEPSLVSCLNQSTDITKQKKG